MVKGTYMIICGHTRTLETKVYQLKSVEENFETSVSSP
jgi:hypothetical protein